MTLDRLAVVAILIVLILDGASIWLILLGLLVGLIITTAWRSPSDG